MLNLQLAHKYSRAIFELAQEEGKLEAYGKELLQVKKDLEDVPAAVAFFANPQVERKAKKELVKKMYEGELSQSIYHFLLLLVDKRRFALLSVIAEQYREMANAARGIVIADVTTAQPATEAQQQKIAAKLEAVTGKRWNSASTRTKPCWAVSWSKLATAVSTAVWPDASRRCKKNY